MAGGNRKEYELLMRLTAALGPNFNSSFQTATNTTKKLQDSLQNMQKVQKNIEGYKKTQDALNATKNSVKELGARHNDLQQKLTATITKEKNIRKALAESEKATGKNTDEYKRLEAELKKTQGQSEKLTDQIKKTENSIDKANDTIKEQRQQLTTLSNRLRESGVDTDNLKSENERLQRSYEDLKRSQENFTRASADLERNKAAISATRMELVKTIGVAAGAGAALYKGFIEPAANFEAQMSIVESISGASAEEMEKLSELAKHMGETMAFTAVESGQALEYMAMAGWDANAMMNGLAGVMNLASASGEDLALVSDVVTDAMTAFNMGAEEANRFADVLAATATSSNTNVGIMAETFKNVAPLAGAMGYSIEDMSVAIGMMANAGVKGSKAGTSLKNIIVNLADPTKEVIQAMKALNLSLVNNDGTTKNFEEVVKNLRESFNGLTESEKAAYAATIGGKQGMAGLLAVVNSAEDDFAKLSASINDSTGAAEQMGTIRLDNLKGDITLAKSAWEGLTISIGNIFLPKLRETTQKISELIAKMTAFVKENEETVVIVTKVAGALLGAKIAYLAAKLAILQIINVIKTVKVAMAAYRVAQAAMSAGTGTWAAISAVAATPTAAFGAAMAAVSWPVLAVVAAIAAVIAIVVLLIKHWDKVKAATLTVWETTKEAFGKVGTFFVEVGEKIKAPFIAVFEWFKNNVIQPVINIFAPIVQKIGEIFLKLWEIITVLFGVLASWFNNNVIKPIIQFFAPIISTVGGFFQETWNKITNKFANVTEWFSEKFTKAWEGIKSAFSEAGTFFKSLWDKITSIFTPIGTAVGTAIGEAFKFVINKIIGFAESLINKFIRSINNAIEIINKIPGVSIETLTLLDIPKLEKGSNFTPDTFIAGDVNGKGGELVTNARGRKVFTAAETNTIFDNINTVKKINDALPRSAVSDSDILKTSIVIELPDNLINSLKDFAENRANEFSGQSIPEIPAIADNKGSELITNAQGRKVFTAAETNTIFDNINTIKKINDALPRSAVSDSDILKAPIIVEWTGNLINSLKDVAENRANEFSGQSMPEIPAIRHTNNTFKIEYHPTINIDGNKPVDLEEKLKQNNDTLLQMFKDFLRQQRDDERRTRYA